MLSFMEGSLDGYPVFSPPSLISSLFSFLIVGAKISQCYLYKYDPSFIKPFFILFFIYSAYHEWLLGDQVDILPHLLLPLAGPEELSEEDMEGMPDDLQYLEEDKQREVEPEIRAMLLEAIFQVREYPAVSLFTFAQ